MSSHDFEYTPHCVDLSGKDASCWPTSSEVEAVLKTGELLQCAPLDPEWDIKLLDALAARLARRLTREQLQALLDSLPSDADK